MNPQNDTQNNTVNPGNTTPIAGTVSGVASAPADDPGRTLAIIGLIVSVAGFAMIGTIVSIVALMKSKAAGFKNSLAVIGIAVGSILFIAGTILLVLFGQLFLDTFGGMIRTCQELGPGTHKVGSTTYECGGTKTEVRFGS